MRFAVAPRSPAIPIAFSAVIVIEAAVLHLWLRANHPLIAWTSTLLSAWAIWFLVSDYLAMRSASLGITDDALEVALGKRVRVGIPRANIERVARATLRDTSAYDPMLLNGTKPGTPNVMITLRAPVEVRVLGLARKRVQRLAVQLAEPDAFVAAAGAAAAPAEPGRGEGGQGVMPNLA